MASLIFCSISCGESFGPNAADVGAAEVVDATVAALAAAGVFTTGAAAGFAPPARIAARISFVELGLGPGTAAGVGLAGGGAAAVGADSEAATVAGVSDTDAGVSTGAAAAAAF